MYATAIKLLKLVKTPLNAALRKNTKLTSHIVCKFMFSCCNATYYGQTQTHFFSRVSEHLGITPLTGKNC